MPLKVIYPKLFDIAREKEILVSEMCTLPSKRTSQQVWNLDFRRKLSEEENTEAIDLLEKLEVIRLRVGIPDKRTWTINNEGSFSIKSIFHSLSKGDRQVVSYFKSIWKNGAPNKVKFRAWLICKKMINISEVLQHRWPTCALSPHVCSFCANGPESISHLFFECPFTSIFWKRFECELGINENKPSLMFE
ncbi:hypothetical protein Sjap_000947 [Stephania japonica]|uniref:Reverse transcriptase zinc-binding domain-containing protein n=1 Tax=Stephania japonica TaxID=461633 RepID=A0AAP0KLC6_9MAGN